MSKRVRVAVGAGILASVIAVLALLFANRFSSETQGNGPVRRALVLESQNLGGRVPGGGEIWEVAIERSGVVLLGTDRGRVYRYDPGHATYHLIFSVPSSIPPEDRGILYISTGGGLMAFATTYYVFIADESGETVQTIDWFEFSERVDDDNYSMPPNSLTPEGKRIVFSATKTYVLQTATGKLERTLPADAELAVYAAEEYVILESGRQIETWGLGGKLSAVIRCNCQGAFGVSTDLTVGFTQTDFDQVTIWDLVSGRRIRDFEIGDATFRQVLDVASDDNLDILALGGDNGEMIVIQGEDRAKLSFGKVQKVTEIAMSSGHKMLVTTENETFARNYHVVRIAS